MISKFSERLYLRGLIVISIVGILSCSFEPALETTLNDYRQRLQRVLDIPVITPVRNRGFAFPDIPDATREFEKNSINLLDLSRLSQCELSSLIAERNTTLGKVQPLSQRFVYEAKLLTLLERCELSIALTHTELSQRIGKIFKIKQSQYTALWGTLIQKSEEIKTALSVSQGTLSNTSEHTDMNSVIALSYLNSLKNNPLAVVNHEVEASLATLQLSRLPAKLWRTQSVLASQLASITEVTAFELKKLDCTKTTDFNKAEILRNIFQLFFVQKIQPIGSKLNHYHYQLQPVWDSWINDDSLSEPFKQYVHHHTVEGFAEYQTQMQNHVVMWQNFFKQCGIEVSATSTR
ncbi:DUF3080 family protein [Alteromonas sp. ASW11-130]|uniref:DUF3080 family protein n=1 Tax=Alteromonas sp. ASW11-130 TaxID=3015775 RepID=UPI0022421270|nr:DUF3080 family protein [Alteromonas sp. ASW11-130]MCW8090632.1 DUF3080 domain-containing protein [Alteromonas sp. ASW11-130]